MNIKNVVNRKKLYIRLCVIQFDFNGCSRSTIIKEQEKAHRVLRDNYRYTGSWKLKQAVHCGIKYHYATVTIKGNCVVFIEDFDELETVVSVDSRCYKVCK